MPFKYKLSRRLAISRTTLLAASIIAVACETAEIAEPTSHEEDVMAVFIQPDSITLQPNQTHRFRAYLSEPGILWPVSWSASGGTITAYGTDTANPAEEYFIPYGAYTAPDEPGEYFVVVSHAQNASVTDTARVIVEPPPLARVVVSPSSVTLDPGQSQRFTAYGQREDGDSVTVPVTYYATGGSISAAGVFTADSSIGTFYALAIYNGPAAAKPLADVATVIVTPLAPTLARVVLMPPSAWLDPGGTVQFSAYGRMSNGDSVAVSVTFAATGGVIDANGLFVAAQLAGEYLVIATDGSGVFSDTSTVYVGIAAPVLEEIILTPETAVVYTSGTVQFAASARTADGDTVQVAVVYVATGGSIAQDGLYTAGQTPGTYRVIAADADGVLADTASVTVVAVPVASVAVSPATATIAEDMTVQLSAEPRDSVGNPLTGRAVSWSSSNPEVATVSASGLVTALTAGITTISCASEGASGTAAITVTAARSGPVSDLSVVSVSQSSVTLQFTEVDDGTGRAARYDIRYAPAPMSWGSSPSVTQGTCTTPVEGTSIGATRTCTVEVLSAGTTYDFRLVPYRGELNVNAVFGPLSNVAQGTTVASSAPVASVTVSPSPASLDVGRQLQLTATLRDAAGNALTNRVVSWASGNSAVATVSPSGLVAGEAAGTATITATSEGVSGAASVSVSPGSGDHPNEPAGLTEIFHQPWDNLPRLSGQPGDIDPFFWNASDNSNIAIVQDITAPESAPNVLEGRFPTSHSTSDGYAPFDLEKRINILAAGATEVYFSWRQKLSSNWQAHRKGNKVMLCWINLGSSDPDGHPGIFTSINTTPLLPLGSTFQEHVDRPLTFSVHTQGVVGDASHGHFQNTGPSGADAVIRGVWQQFEVYIKLNPVAGNSSGSIIRFWVDGVLVGDYWNHMLVGTGQDSGFGLLFEFSPYYGGGASDPITQDMFMSVDHIYMSGNQ